MQLLRSHELGGRLEVYACFENGSPANHAFCPALKGCHSWGHSPEEAPANIREAAELYVEDLIDAGDPIHNPQDGTIVIPAPAVVVSRQEMLRRSITAREFVAALTRGRVCAAARPREPSCT